MAEPYAFREMSSADLSLIRRWLATPEVVRWWGEPEQQFELVSGDLDEPDLVEDLVEEPEDDEAVGRRRAPGRSRMSGNRSARARSPASPSIRASEAPRQ